MGRFPWASKAAISQAFNQISSSHLLPLKCGYQVKGKRLSLSCLSQRFWIITVGSLLHSLLADNDPPPLPNRLIVVAFQSSPFPILGYARRQCFRCRSNLRPTSAFPRLAGFGEKRKRSEEAKKLIPREWYSIQLFFIILLSQFLSTLTAFNLSQLAASAAYKIKLGALWNLEQMTWCRLGISAGIFFNDYGCWCGRGGAGRTVDGIDAWVFFQI